MKRLFELLESRRAYSICPQEESEPTPWWEEDAPAMPLVHDTMAPQPRSTRATAPVVGAFIRPAPPKAA